MSKELLRIVIDEGVKYNLDSFFLNVSNAYAEIEDDLSVYDDDRFANFQAIGDIAFSANEKLVVVTAEVGEDLTERSGKKAQYEKAKKILKDYMKYDAGIFVFSDPAGSFRFSLVYGQAEGTRRSWSNFRRFTYFASRDQTNNTYLGRVGGCDFSSLDIIKDAFSVEKVNKEFYKEIAKYYYRLTGKNGYKRDLVLPSVREDDDKKYEEYAVRLIGRIIFCWFLKHKKSASGIPLIPKEALSVSSVQNNANYYHSILEPLFFEVMNKPVKDRKSIIIPQSDRIPFLNGGLFEPHVNDYYQNMPNSALKIPNRWFEDFLGVLEQYNFTIDENSIVDADVSVDPEMLGRIFENLLAEVVPETGETARKATGSYYTPRAIVDYMVEQSLKQYLLIKTALPEDKLNRLLSYEDDSIDLADSERNAVVMALKEIKVIDPACGSGAFPMGILHRMLLILEKADTRLEIWRRLYLSTYHPVMRRIIEDKLRKGNEQYIRKLTIIQDSIYGVDIQPIAVDIAKLRCFLSLVVDELVLDNEENRGIEPLPNLEFKFVAANTLIGLPSIASQSAFGITATINKLKELREAYLRSFGAEKLQIEKEFRATQQKLFKENIEWALSDTQVKRLTEWDPFSYESCAWFDPEWMFGISDGFDMVVANPPYVDSEEMTKSMPGLRETISALYSTAKGNWDLYIPFWELSYKLTAELGNAVLITPNKWLSIKYGEKLREFLQKHIYRVGNCNQVNVFEAGNTPVVVFVNKATRSKVIQIDTFDEDYLIHEKVNTDGSILHYGNWGLLLSRNIKLLEKLMSSQHKVVHDYVAENPFTVSEAYEMQELLRDLSTLRPYNPEEYLKFVNTGTIDKYLFLWGKKKTTYLKKKYLFPIVEKKAFARRFPRRYIQMNSPKIIISGIRHFECVLDINADVVAGKSTLILKSRNESNYKAILGILNSRVITFFINEAYGALGIEGGINFTTDLVESLPLPLLDMKASSNIENVVARIIAMTSDDDYHEEPAKQEKVRDYQHQIDQMVYELYGLTPEDIAVVEGSIASK